MNGTLIDIAKWWAALRKDEPAIITPTDRITYAEIDAWAEALCDGLIDDGVQMGDRVSIFGANCLEWCILAQGIMRAGAILGPLNARFTVSEASYMLGRYESKLLFYDVARQSVAEELARLHPGTRLKALSEVNALRRRSSTARRAPEAITPDTNVVIIPTSGSTAHPKGVVYSHRSMLSYQTEFAMAEPGVIDHARLLLFAPLSTSAGYVLLTQFLAYGGTVYVYDAFDPQRALKCIVEEKITSVMGAPVFFERMAACAEFADADLSHIRMSTCGGARVSQQLLNAWKAKGVLIRQIYGQTELGGQCTINTLEAALTNPEKCGRGMPFTRMAVMDPAGNFLPPNTPGEIVVKGAGMMVGYWRDPEATARTIVDGWLRTGDLGVIDENGLLTMLDRIKDIIISGGLNISAAEVERVVSEFAGVDEVAAIAAKDERFGETPLAVVYSAGGVDVTKLIAHCCKHLSDYKVPRFVAVEKEPLPRLATGKIAKPALRTKYADAHLRLPRVR